MNVLRISAYILAITVICLIVLAFAVHGLAVGGIYAFNNWQARKGLGRIFTQTAPAAQKTTAPTEEPAAASGVYTVKKGDTLASIARNLGVPLAELVKANKITDPNKLQPGQPLKLPQRKS